MEEKLKGTELTIEVFIGYRYNLEFGKSWRQDLRFDISNGAYDDDIKETLENEGYFVSEFEIKKIVTIVLDNISILEDGVEAYLSVYATLRLVLNGKGGKDYE